MSVVISSQTGGSGAPEITDDQPCSGGPSRELHNIIGVRGRGFAVHLNNACKPECHAAAVKGQLSLAFSILLCLSTVSRYLPISHLLPAQPGAEPRVSIA